MAGDRWIVGGAKREEHVRRGQGDTVRELDARLERDGVGQAVGRRGPALGQPRLELIGRAVDAHEPSLRQECHDVGGGNRACGDVAVVGWRLGSNRGDELPAPRRRRGRSGRRRRRLRRTGRRRNSPELPRAPPICTRWPRQAPTGQFLGQSPIRRKSAFFAGYLLPGRTGRVGEPTCWLYRLAAVRSRALVRGLCVAEHCS